MTKFFKNPDVIEERRNSEVEQMRRQRPGRPGQIPDDSVDNLIEIHETRHKWKNNSMEAINIFSQRNFPS